MELSLQIVPIGDTTPHEIAAASQELQDNLGHLPGLSRVESDRIPAPDGSKGAFVAALGSLALSVAPTILEKLLGVVSTVLARQPAPTEIVIKTKNGEVSARFDPKKITLDEIADYAKRLRATGVLS